MEIYNRWKFRGPASGNVDGLLLAISDGKVIGQLGQIPVKLKYGKEIYDAQWTCDVIVDPDQRGTGVGRKMFDFAMKRDMIGLGHNASPSANGVMVSMGFKPMPCARSMVFPVNADHILKWITPDKFNFAIPFIKKIVQPYFTLKTNRLKKAGSNFEICRWEDVAGLISQRQDEIQNPQILHDKDFLNWRATGLEKYSPRISGARSDKGSYVLHSPFSPYYNIYDWHCKNSDEVRNMISLVVRLAIENNSQTIQIIANDEEEEAMLSKLGFIRSRHNERIIHYSKNNLLDKAVKFYFTLYDTDLNL